MSVPLYDLSVVMDFTSLDGNSDSCTSFQRYIKYVEAVEYERRTRSGTSLSPKKFDKCSVCFEDCILRSHKRTIVTLDCSHTFHETCLHNHWQAEVMKMTCPNCRKDYDPHGRNGPRKSKKAAKEKLKKVFKSQRKSKDWLSVWLVNDNNCFRYLYIFYMYKSYALKPYRRRIYRIEFINIYLHGNYLLKTDNIVCVIKN